MSELRDFPILQNEDFIVGTERDRSGTRGDSAPATAAKTKTKGPSITTRRSNGKWLPTAEASLPRPQAATRKSIARIENHFKSSAKPLSRYSWIERLTSESKLCVPTQPDKPPPI